jgi:hypothetical protein
MSKEMREQIDNFKNFLLKENRVSTYNEMFNLIVEYIKKTLNSEKKINEYVPNTHIAEHFKDVLIYLELENIYPNEFHIEHQTTGEQWTKEKGTEYITNTVKSDYHILKWLETGEYFNKELLKQNGEDEIHRVYQKLRDKYDEVRNTMKIVNIHLDSYIMKHLVKKDLKSHKIKIK